MPDVVGRMKWAMLLLALSAIYRLVIMYGGGECRRVQRRCENAADDGRVL
jgi:hypothetical protein